MRDLRIRTGIVLALLTGFSSLALAADNPQQPGFDAVVAEYLGIALDSNLALRTQDIEVERSVAALDAARARYFPELSLNARYTLASGGREIDFPIGQLLNPAYQTLNQLLVAQGQTPRFGSLTDQRFPLQRPYEQDTRITLRQPLYQPAIPAAVSAQRELLGSQQYARIALAHQLRRDVVLAYAGYLKALRAAEIVASGSALLQENLRVTESLYRNGRITQDQLLRAQAERLGATQQQREADGAVAQARSYVNFLLNRPLDTALQDAWPTPTNPTHGTALDGLRADALAQRSELAQLDALGRAADAQVRATQATRGPQLALGVDAGIQGEHYRVGSGEQYIAASLELSWKFFDGGANRAAVAESRSAARSLAVRRQQAAQQVQLEVQQALDRLETTRDSLATDIAREQAATAALRIASRKRDEGALTQVEFLDARNAQTAAALNLNLLRFSLLERSAELDYATGAGDLPSAARPALGNTP